MEADSPWAARCRDGATSPLYRWHSNRPRRSLAALEGKGPGSSPTAALIQPRSVGRSGGTSKLAANFFFKFPSAMPAGNH
ncbi:hypothetical protein MRX96_016523 [Rhipicephalus microplus]